MSGSVIEIGDKLHIITRRRFEDETRRHFIGEVTGISGVLCKVEGYVFVFQAGANEYKKQPQNRVRLFSVDQEGFIVNKIPRGIDIASLDYQIVEERLAVTDGGGFTLDVNEFGDRR